MFTAVVGLAPIAVLFRLAPVFTCVVLKAIGIVGKVTALPVYCWGFSMETPRATVLLGMEDQAELRSTFPSQAQLVVRVHILRRKTSAGITAMPVRLGVSMLQSCPPRNSNLPLR